MDEIGIDIARHRPIAIEDLDDTSFDLIVTLAPEAHHKALELTRTMAADVEYWPTVDPSAAAGNRERMAGAPPGGARSAFRADQGPLRFRRRAASLSGSARCLTLRATGRTAGYGRISSTFSAGRQSLAPFSVTTIGRSMRIGSATMKPISSSSVHFGSPRPSSA